MSTRSIQLSEEVQRYLLDVTVNEPEVLKELREETAKLENAMMQISPEQGQFMRLLCEMLGVERALEIGVFTGYSSLCVALSLPDSGKLVGCDVSEEYTQVARRYYERAQVAHKIELRIAPALETLSQLLSEGQAGSFDFAFIDADKQNYTAYYERCHELVRVGGLIAIDNTLWSGTVADPSDQRETTQAIRALNQTVCTDARVTASLVPIGDGLLLARKRR